MTGALGLAALALLVTACGFALLAAPLGPGRAATGIVASAGVRVAFAAKRYADEVVHDSYTDVASDTHRYLLIGRARWLDSVPLTSGVTPDDGTTGTFALGQVLFMVLGDHRLLVFAAGAALGAVGIWAAVAALYWVRPDAHPGFAWLLLLYPTTAYWTASFGKDSVTMLALGLVLLALARAVTTGRLHAGSTVMAAGALAIMLFIRLDIAVALSVGIVLAMVAVGPARSGAAARAVVPERSDVAGEAVARLRWTPLLAAFLGLPTVLAVAMSTGMRDPWGVIEEFAGTAQRTSIGTSNLYAEAAVPGSGALNPVLGLFTAVFRPLPWESGIIGLITSVDTLTAVVTVALLVRALLRAVPWHPAAAYLAVAALFFAFAVFVQLTQFGNLGLLVRLRSLTMPALLIVIALLPALGPRTGRAFPFRPFSGRGAYDDGPAARAGRIPAWQSTVAAGRTRLWLWPGR